MDIGYNLEAALESIESYEESSVEAREEQAPPFYIKRMVENGKRHSIIYFLDSIPMEKIALLVDELYVAEPTDRYDFVINTYSSMYMDYLPLCNAALSTQAQVETYLDFNHCIGAILFWLCGDKIHIGPFTDINIALPTTINLDNTKSMVEDSVSEMEFVKTILASFVASGLLTNEEYIDIVDKKKNICINATKLFERFGEITSLKE